MEGQPSSVHLYPEDEPDDIDGAFQVKHVGTIFEEAKQELLKLMRIEVGTRSLFNDHTHSSTEFAFLQIVSTFVECLRMRMQSSESVSR